MMKTFFKDNFNLLSNSCFNLSCPGVVMPLCHHLIEGIKVGSIPITNCEKLLIPNLNEEISLQYSNLDELIPLYQALDLYLITSREEGGPMGLMESMSCGIPVVTTKVGMAEDVVSEDIPGEISCEFDSTNLANKVETLLNYFYKNKDLNQEKIRRHILKFDWQEVAKQHLEKVYKDLI